MTPRTSPSLPHSTTVDAIPNSPSGHWWREWEAGLLVVLVAVLFLPRLTFLNVRGEEPRRAQVAVEMGDSGDWIVPHQQGQLYFSRPPLQNWTIGLLGRVLGEVNSWAIRLPSVLATLGVVLLIYVHGRTFLSRTASLAAGVAFASFAQVLELGRLGETDMMFTLFVTGSLLLWHHGRVCGWSPAKTWSAAYFMVALGTLTKGPQAPVYFVATIAVYLLVTRKWRDAFCWGHLAGIGVFLVVWGSWQVPYYMAVGFDGTMRIYGRNVAVRFNDTTWYDYVNHFIVYPFEIVFGCLLPWSIMLLAYISRDFRRHIGTARDHVVFFLVAILVTFPSVWFVPTARSRYFMPLYPCFALLIGLAIDRCWQAETTASWRRIWPRFLGALAVLMIAAGIGILAVSLVARWESPYAQTTIFATGYLLVTIVLALVTIWSSRGTSTARRVVGMLAVALFMGTTLIGPFANSLARRSLDQQGMIAELKSKMPEDARLVSFGKVHHLFTYHYRDFIEPLPIPKPGEPLPDDVEYFCFENHRVRVEDLPPNVEVIATISCDRFKKPEQFDVITVCRRTDGD